MFQNSIRKFRIHFSILIAFNSVGTQMKYLLIFLFSTFNLQAFTLHEAVSMNSAKEVNQLIKNGADIDEIGGFLKDHLYMYLLLMVKMKW